MIQAYVPDLILLDVMMEPMDGWQTLMNLKRNPDSCRIPVIMVSGKTPTPDDVHMYGKYYEHFVMKPVSFPVLFDVVSRVLSPPVIRTRLSEGIILLSNNSGNDTACGLMGINKSE
jgi:CheY-like chemotaxis protein